MRQVMEGEARVLGKTRATLLAVCHPDHPYRWTVRALHSDRLGLDRRRDFAIMKALGASRKLLNGFFAAEAAALGVGRRTVLDSPSASASAFWIGRANFHAAGRTRDSACLPLDSRGQHCGRPALRRRADFPAAAGSTCYHSARGVNDQA